MSHQGMLERICCGRVESPISTADRPNADVFSNNRWGPPGGRTLPLSCSESATPDSGFGAGRSGNFEDSNSSQAGMPMPGLSTGRKNRLAGRNVWVQSFIFCNFPFPVRILREIWIVLEPFLFLF